MNIEEARLYLEHTSKEDFNLEEWQKENRYQAIQVVLEEIERLNKDNGDIIKLFAKEREETKRLNNIIKEVKEYIESYNLPKDLGVLGEAPISISELKHILEILDKVGSDKE